MTRGGHPDIGVLGAFQASATGDLATLACTPQGLVPIDLVDGLDRVQLPALIGLPIGPG